MKMKIIFGLIFLGLGLFFLHRLESLKSKNDTLLNNQKILLQQKNEALAKNQHYKICDSLNAAKIYGLQLTLDEYKQYKSEDLQLIKQLKLKKSNLEDIISAQLQTINSFSCKSTDTVIYMLDTIQSFSYNSKWIEVSGNIYPKSDSVSIQIKNRESLKIVETVVYKRFLGFLWKTNKVKNRQVDIVSENPHTSIIDFDYVTIKQ